MPPVDLDNFDLDIQQVFSTIVVVAIIAVVLTFFFAVAGDISGDQEDRVQYPAVDTAEQLKPDIRIERGTNAIATTGNALYFDEGDTINGVSGADNLTDGNFSLAVAPAPNVDASGIHDVNRTVTSVDNGSAVIYYNESHYVGYYDNGSANATVALDANATGEFDPLALTATDSTLTLYNETHNASAQLTNSTDKPPMLFDWVGRLDELRTFNSTLSASDAEAYTDDPVQPLPGTNRTARYMFDEGSGGTFAYFANESVAIDGATWTDGLTGPGQDRGSDYQLSDNPPQIVVQSGGYLDGAPVVHVRSGGGAFSTLLTTLEGIGSAAISLVALTVLMLAAGRIMGVIEEF